MLAAKIPFENSTWGWSAATVAVKATVSTRHEAIKLRVDFTMESFELSTELSGKVSASLVLRQDFVLGWSVHRNPRLKTKSELQT